MAKNKHKDTKSHGSDILESSEVIAEQISKTEKFIEENKKKMQAAVKKLDFIEAARLRDENKELEKLLQQKS